MSNLRDIIFIVLCTGIIVFFGADKRPLLKSSEGRVAVVAQEMLRDGDWAVPHLNGEIRKEKPPLSSWLVALTTKLSGSGQVEPMHAFLPAGICAILLTLLIYFWLNRVTLPAPDTPAESCAPCSNWLPMAGALMFAATPGFYRQARSAELDMLLALLIACSFYAFWSYRSEGSVCALLLGYGALALTVLTKGHVGLVLVVPPLLAWWLFERSKQSLPLRAQNAFIWHAVGIALLLAIVLPWAIPFLERSGITWADFNREGGGGRFGGTESHREVIEIGGAKFDNYFWYLYHIPGWMLPWSVLLPLALWQTRELPPDERSPLRRLCWLWLGWGTLLFSLMSSKQRHYAAPLFAPMAMLTADATVRWLQHHTPNKQSFARTTLLVLSMLTGVAFIVAALLWVRQVPDDKLPVLSIGGICAGVFLLAGVAARKKSQCFFLWWAGAACAAVLMMITLEKDDIQHESAVGFCRRVREEVPQNVPLYDYRVVFSNNVWKAQVLFELRRKVTRTEQTISELLDAKETRYALVTNKVLEDVSRELYDVVVLERNFMSHRYDALLIRSRGADQLY
jgi:4-amino-4-deoxy-L-arabinose transferase-like glycosyltransferase